MDPALENLLRYFDALERYDVDEALTYFTEDVIYHHPPYGEAGHPGHENDDPNMWHRAVGREELRKLWEFRGEYDAKHHVTAFARTGDLCFNEAFASLNGNENLASWISVFRVDDSGRIAEYQSYLQLPRRPILGSETPITLPA